MARAERATKLGALLACASGRATAFSAPAVAKPGQRVQTKSLRSSAPSLADGRGMVEAHSTSNTESSPCSTGLPSAFAGMAAVWAVMRRRRKASLRRARGGEEVASGLKPPDQWIGKLDLQAFGKEVHELGLRLKSEQGEQDQKHLRKMITWSRICAVIGLSTMWMGVNPISVIFLSLWTHSAWTMIGHHVCHGGYNRTCPTGRYSSRGFAVGTVKQRLVDWFDWMLPEAWSVEHNNLHHYRLGEETDPDLLERNAAKWTGVKRYALPVISMFLWKWSYYAPNTYKELKVAKMRREGKPLPEGFDPLQPLTLSEMARGGAKGIFSFGELVTKVIGPYFLWRFIVMPLPLALVNPAFYTCAVANLLLSDVLSNIHGFIVIVTNHAGDDLYRFDVGCKPKSPTFYLRAITSSANFRTGGNANDFMHGWLNYQIEHHCWPELSMLAYQRGQPELKRICEKHGVPYVQENVFVRLKKTMAIAMGMTKMRVYPMEWESEKDKMVWNEEKTRQAAP